MRTERELLVECLERLNRLGLPYMLVGSTASNYWGIPRTTHDLDFVIAYESSDADRLTECFRHGFFVQAASIRSALAPPYRFNAIDESSALKVDVRRLKKDSFEVSVVQRRRPATLFGTPALVASPEGVILHKLYWNRLPPSDRRLHDAAGVVSVHGDSLDGDYLRLWASHLGVMQELDGRLQGRLRPKST